MDFCFIKERKRKKYIFIKIIQSFYKNIYKMNLFIQVKTIYQYFIK